MRLTSPYWLLPTVCLAILQACGGSKKDEPVVIDPVEPEAPEVTTLNIDIVDATDETKKAQNVTLTVKDGAEYLADSQASYHYDGSTLVVEIDQSALEDVNGDFIVDNSVSLKFITDSDDYLSTSFSIPVVQLGENNYTFDAMVSVSGTAPVGVAVQTTTADLSNLSLGGVVVVAEATDKNDEKSSTAQLSIPSATVMVDETGEALDLENLEITVAAFDPTEETSLVNFPGGFTTELVNVSDLEQNAIDNGQSEEEAVISGGAITMQSAGFVSIDIKDDQGREADSIIGREIPIRMDIPPDTVNPETGEEIALGDIVPVFSYNDETAEWKFEGDAPVQMDEQTGTLFAQINISHFSYYNFDWYKAADKCEPTVYFKDVTGAPLSTSFKLSTRVSEGNWSSWGLWGGSVSDAFIQFLNIDDSPVDMQFFVAGQKWRVEQMSGIDGTLSDDQYTIFDVNMCDSDQGQVVLSEVITPSLTINKSQSVSEGVGSLAVEFSLSEVGTDPVSFNVATEQLSSGAVDGEDYTGVSQVITIPVGQTSASLSIPIIDNAEPETVAERFRVNVTNVQGAIYDINYRPVTVILDDDQPTLTVQNVVVDEDAGQVSVDVTLAPVIEGRNELTAVVNALASTATASLDYSLLATTATFDVGATDTQQITLNILDDIGFEAAPNETVVFDLAVEDGPTDSVTLEIVDNDDLTDDAPTAASLTLVGAYTTEVDGANLVKVPVPLADLDSGLVEGYGDGESGFVVKVALDKSSSMTTTVTLAYSAAATSGAAGTADDYSWTYGDSVASADYLQIASVEFVAGEVEKLIEIPVYGDLVAEAASESFSVAIDTAMAEPVPANGQGPFTVAAGASSSVDLVIIDDDRLVLEPVASVVSVFEGRSTTFTLKKSSFGVFEQNVTVNYTTRNSSAIVNEDFVHQQGTVTWSAASGESESFTIATLDDVHIDADHKIFIDFSADDDRVMFERSATVIIKNNDYPPLVYIGSDYVNEGDVVEFELSLSYETSTDTTVQLSTRDNTAQAGTDYEETSGTVTIPAGSTQATFSVPTVALDGEQGDRSFTVDINAASVPLGNTSARGYIQDIQFSTGASSGAGSL